MEEPLLKTKIIPPRISDDTLIRNRLLNYLRSNIDKRLISVCADAGYGKTTLIAQFIKKIDIPYIWYQVDRADQDLMLFMRYLIEGLRMHVPGFGKRTLSVLKHSSGPRIQLEVLIGTFINELLEISQEKIVFIFDDLQEVYTSSKVMSGFESLLNHLPVNASIIVSARSNLPFSVEHLVLKNDVLDINQQDLKFNKEEIKMLCTRLGKFSPTHNEIATLESDSEGWITYLQFCVKPFGQRPQFSRSTKSLINRLYDYFDREVYSSLDDELKFFLAATSVFERLSPEACNFLTSRHDSGKILQEMEKRHLFLSIYDAPRPLYGYHRLFRDFLSLKLREQGIYQKIQQRAGTYVEKKKILSAAVEHYYEGENFKSVARLIAQLGDEYIAQGKVEFIKHYIENLPESIVNINPLLLRLRGNICIWYCNWDSAKSYYSQARRIAQHQKNHLEAFKITHAQLSMKLNLGNHRGVVREIKKVLRSKKLKNRKLRARFLNILGIAFSFERRLTQAIRAFEEVLKISKRLRDDAKVNVTLNNLATANSDSGNFSRAQHYLEILTDKLRKEPSPLLIAALYNLGALLKDQGTLTKAEKIAREGLKYSQLYNDKNMLCMSHINLGLIKIYSGELEQAEDLLNTAEKLAWEMGHNFRLSHVWNSMAELAIQRGDLYKAKQYSDKALELPIPAMNKAGFLITAAAVEISLRNLSTAERTLKQALPGVKESNYLLTMVYLQMARLYLLKKTEVKAKQFIQKSISLAEKNSYDFLMLYELNRCPDIVRFVKKMSLKSRYLQHILLKMPYPESLDIIVEPGETEYDIIIRLFGEVRITKRGKEIKTSSWRTRRFQELFCFFADNRQTEVKREKIINTFWPNHPPQMAKQLFYNALYSIRKTIVKDVILFDKKTYSLSAKYHYWIDTEEFETLINTADRLVKDGNRAAGLIQYEEAASLYRGGFMDDFYSEWCQQRRRYFEGLYLYILRHLAQGHYELGNYDKALRFCKLFIDKDPYYEEAHCVAMRCYAALNDLGGLRTCFARLKEVLAQGLKTAPRSETVTLFETLIKQRKHTKL
jgi:LuxR family maltose regulon positive regulatory protein